MEIPKTPGPPDSFAPTTAASEGFPLAPGAIPEASLPEKAADREPSEAAFCSDPRVAAKASDSNLRAGGRPSSREMVAHSTQSDDAYAAFFDRAEEAVARLRAQVHQAGQAEESEVAPLRTLTAADVARQSKLRGIVMGVVTLAGLLLLLGLVRTSRQPSEPPALASTEAMAPP